MEYHLQNNSDIEKLAAEVIDADTLVVTTDNISVTAVISRISDNHLYLEMDEGKEKKGVNVFTADDTGGKWVMIDGISYFVEDLDNSSVQKSRKKTGANLPGVITPPMPAIVVSVPVKPGDVVEKGQKLVILTAMKMETTLSAPFNGTITAVNVKEGDKVSPGDILVDLTQGEQEA